MQHPTFQEPAVEQRGEMILLSSCSQIVPLKLVGSLAANESFLEVLFKRALKGGSGDPEAWEKYPVSQATSPTPFWGKAPSPGALVL